MFFQDLIWVFRCSPFWNKRAQNNKATEEWRQMVELHLNQRRRHDALPSGPWDKVHMNTRRAKAWRVFRETRCCCFMVILTYFNTYTLFAFINTQTSSVKKKNNFRLCELQFFLYTNWNVHKTGEWKPPRDHVQETREEENLRARLFFFHLHFRFWFISLHASFAHFLFKNWISFFLSDFFLALKNWH